MCGIFAAISLRGVREDVVPFEAGLTETSALRGRDGTGVKWFDWGFIGASRARPLPEGFSFEYPHSYKDKHIVFNGTLSNADILAKELGIPISVDTEVIGPYIDFVGEEEAARKFVGGFAIIVAEKNGLTIIRNFKTLWYLRLENVILVASEKEFLDGYGGDFMSGREPVAFPRDTIFRIYNGVVTFTPFTTTIWGGVELDNNKAIVVASGGLDSATAAAVAKKIHGKEVLMLNFDYGQRAAKKEWEAVQLVAERIGVKCQQIDISKLGVFDNSPLTDTNMELPLGKISVESTLCLVGSSEQTIWKTTGENVNPQCIKEGDILYAIDEKTNTLSTTEVKQILTREVDSYLCIEVNNGKKYFNKIRCTDEHPFYVINKGWVQAKDLKENDMLMHITDVEEKNILHRKSRKVINWKEMGRKVSLSCLESGYGKQISERMKKFNPMKDVKQRERMKKFNPMKDPKIVKKVLSNACHKPNKLEKMFIDFFNGNENPIKYVGDGSLLVGERNLCPDFIVSGTNKLIEVYDGSLYKWLGKERGETWINERRDYFTKNGYECIFFDCNSSYQLPFDGIAKKVNEYIHNGVRVKSIKRFNKKKTKVYNYHCEPHNNFIVNGCVVHNCWTPARNFAMLAIATAKAESEGYKWLYFGNNLEEESTGYVDNDLEFVVRMNSVLQYATLRGVKVKRALARLMKVDIITLGTFLGVPFEYTWSCDEGFDIPCGKCGCCTTRRHTFVEAGIEDKQTYLEPLTDRYFSGKVTQPDIKTLIKLVEEI